MEQIQAQAKDQQHLATQVLSWITCATSPLTTLELQHALAVEIGETFLDGDNLPDVEDLVSACAGLVTVDERSDIIGLVHYTTQQYFNETQAQWFSNAEANITTACVMYQSLSAFDGACGSSDAFAKRLRVHPLYTYAKPETEATAQVIIKFLKDNDKVEASIEALLARESSVFDTGLGPRYLLHKGPSQMTGLHMAAYFGMSKIARTLLEDGQEIEAKDTFGHTPLSLCAKNGHEDVAKLLIDNGADVGSKERAAQTPLSLAARNGHAAVVRVLLEGAPNRSLWMGMAGRHYRMLHNGDANLLGRQTGDYGRVWSHGIIACCTRGTRICFAGAARGGANPESVDAWGQTASSYAAEGGHEAITKLLLLEHIKSSSSLDGYEAAVKQLLPPDEAEGPRHDQDLTANNFVQGNYLMDTLSLEGQKTLQRNYVRSARVNPWNPTGVLFKTPLWWAASRGYAGVVKVLLAQRDTNPDFKDAEFGETPLSQAAMNGHEAFVRLLVDNGANTELKNKDGQTPLALAAKNGYGHIVRLLVAIGADTESRDTDGDTPLLLAANNGHEAVVGLLTEKCTKIGSTDCVA
ncbi:hypothetical protein ACCO45_010064 [Purpureocillium lilacinum]|uniref:Uncharacterized protein n=1 Tax=Purpureocillium lilacinum TaxID=33203 RepID=A0ACC4DE37_PURLI